MGHGSVPPVAGVAGDVVVVVAIAVSVDPVNCNQKSRSERNTITMSRVTW